MFVGLTNTPRDYAWGSRTAIAELLGRSPSGGPEAELWFGTHSGSPTRLIDAPRGETTLDQLVDLPFILKVLAAESSLSLQAHPSTALAEEGFAREDALGIPLGDPRRNYKDASAKPEMIYALEDGLVALCGFRSAAATRDLLSTLGPDPLVADWIDRLVDDFSIRAVFEWLIADGDGVPALRDRVLTLADVAVAPEFANVLLLARDFPGDAGILLSLLLNLVTLEAGQAIYLPAGNIHAYQRGLGIEVLAASDNVLRGGLTPKHVDVAELLNVLDFRPLPVPFLVPDETTPGVAVFRPDAPDFELAVITPVAAPVAFEPGGNFVALCAAGELDFAGAVSTTELFRGDAIFGTVSESPLVVSGSGTVFVASTNRSDSH
jgi:mannose-6-phosphate isomerase